MATKPHPIRTKEQKMPLQKYIHPAVKFSSGQIFVLNTNWAKYKNTNEISWRKFYEESKNSTSIKEIGYVTCSLVPKKLRVMKDYQKGNFLKCGKFAYKFNCMGRF